MQRTDDRAARAPGSSATNDVDSERISTAFSDWFTISPYVERPVAVQRPLVLPDLVEHDDGVVERETEDRQERGDRRGRDLELEQRVHADVKMMSWITAMIAAAAIFHSKRIERYTREHDEEDDERLERLAADLVDPTSGRRCVMLTSFDVDARVLGERRARPSCTGLVGSFVDRAP